MIVQYITIEISWITLLCIDTDGPKLEVRLGKSTRIVVDEILTLQVQYFVIENRKIGWTHQHSCLDNQIQNIHFQPSRHLERTISEFAIGTHR